MKSKEIIVKSLSFGGDCWWRSAQIGQHIYVTGGQENSRRCIKFVRDDMGYFVQETKLGMNQARQKHSLCTDGRFLFASGSAKFQKKQKKNHKGQNSADQWSVQNCFTVEKYDPIIDTWTQMPNLQNGRSQHSSCCLYDNLYVFAGKDQNQKLEKSIERINYQKLQHQWTVIHISSDDFATGTNPCVTHLNSTQILILGGDSKAHRNNACIFNVHSCEIDSKIKTINFITPVTYPCFLLKEGKVIAGNYQPGQIIRFNNQRSSDKKTKILEELDYRSPDEKQLALYNENDSDWRCYEHNYSFDYDDHDVQQRGYDSQDEFDEFYDYQANRFNDY